MPGGIQVFARALDMTTEELFKAMENGELLAGEVLPLVADELKRTARNNDALTKSLTTSRSQWTLFVNNFKLLFDGFGSTLLDRGVARFIQALSKLLKVVKPLAQALFGLLGVILSLVGEIGKGILSAFDPILNIFKAFSEPLKEIKEQLLGVDTAFMDWFGNLSKFIVFLHPLLRAFAIIGGVIEEIINIFTGHAQGILAGEGETIAERLANGMLGRLDEMFDKWWRDKFIPGFKSKMNELGLIIKEALKGIFPEWMWPAGEEIASGYNRINQSFDAIGMLKSTARGLDSLVADVMGVDKKAAQERLQDKGVDFIPAGVDKPTQFNLYIDGEKKMEAVIDKKTQQDLVISYD